MTGSSTMPTSAAPRRAGRYDVRVVDDHGRSEERALEVSLVQ
jgi:hypothetical protein